MLLAHGLPAQVQDIPVPLSWFYASATVILVASFLLLGALWTQPRWDTPPWRPLPPAISRLLLAAWLRGAVALILLAGTALVVAAATFGSLEVGDNIVAVLVFVVWWIGIVPLSVLLGDVWGACHPIRTLLALLGGRHEAAPATEALGSLPGGVWPAAGGLLLFVWFELVYPTATHPRLLGILVAAWLLITTAGALRSGAHAWLSSREPFAVYTNLLARMSIFERRDTPTGLRLGMRPPAIGVLGVPAASGLVALCTLLIGSVSYDGLSRTRWWTVKIADATVQLSDSGISAATARLIFGTFGMIMMCLIALGAFELASWAAGRLGNLQRGGGQRAAMSFAPTLLPIAVAYVAAHYCSFFILQGQDIIRLASDPLGRGWNLFGTNEFRIHYSLLSSRGVWFIQVGSIIVGHVLGLVLAHERALELAPTSRAATRSQLAMLALMVLYTVGGLYFLSEGLA